MSRRGSSLIEVVLALVLLAVAGTALIALLGQTTLSIESLRASERRTRAASLELQAIAILNRSELAARVGGTISHGWSVFIDRSSTDLFDVTIAASDTGTILLRTILYRPDTVSNAIP